MSSIGQTSKPPEKAPTNTGVFLYARIYDTEVNEVDIDR